MGEKHVLTIATGKKIYIDMAVNLARSFFLWHTDNDISFMIITDNKDMFPVDVAKLAEIIAIDASDFGEGFSTKLHLDKFVRAGHTLFIDSDCLIYGNLAPVFEKFEGHAVSVVGGYISSGDWFGNVTEICKKFNLQRMPKFNGGIYYLEKGDQAQKVYELARQLEKQYDEIGFCRLRNRPNDEVIVSLAMALTIETPVTDDGTVMSDPLCCQGTFSTNVISGKTVLCNPPKPNPLHQDWYPFEKVSPLVVHFLGHHTHGYQYKKDTYLLKSLQGNKLNIIYKISAYLTIELPTRLKTGLKNVFRPVYKIVFGIRSVKPSERL